MIDTPGDGRFSVEVPDLNGTLSFSTLGYRPVEVELSGAADLLVELQRAPLALEEVVAVGYGTQRRGDLTGSVSSITRADIADLPVYSMDNLLQGLAAGVEVSANGLRPGQASTIRIRGTRSLVASNDPLFVIDGMPVDGGIMDLNPGDVESVEVLKDASATAIYGSRGANGVILVTTRRGYEGPTQFNYSGSYGIQEMTRRLQMMDTRRFAEMKRQAEIHQGARGRPQPATWAIQQPGRELLDPREPEQ